MPGVPIAAEPMVPARRACRGLTRAWDARERLRAPVRARQSFGTPTASPWMPLTVVNQPLSSSRLDLGGPHLDVDAHHPRHLRRGNFASPVPACGRQNRCRHRCCRWASSDPERRSVAIWLSATHCAKVLSRRYDDGVGRGGERPEHRRHADRHDGERHQHLDQSEAAAAPHGLCSTIGCSTTCPLLSSVRVTLRTPPSRSSVAAKVREIAVREDHHLRSLVLRVLRPCSAPRAARRRSA